MLRVSLAFVVLALASGLLHGAVEIGSAAPDFEFIRTWNMPGGQSRLSGYRGSTVLLETFATW